MLENDNIRKIDKSDMFSLIKNMYHQLEKSILIADKCNFIIDVNFKNIIINGMGGSAIGGDFVSVILKD